MPQTQAFSVNWTVEIQPEGDVSNDVAGITVVRNGQGEADTATIELDTSQRPHALEEREDVHVEITDGNATEVFDGFVDKVSDRANEPKVVIDARTDSGLLDDILVAGKYSADNFWKLIDKIIDTGHSAIDGISFDHKAHRDRWNVFWATDFGSIDIHHRAELVDSANEDEFTQALTLLNRGKKAELRFDNYKQLDAETYTLTITGEDAEGDTVTATVDLPTGYGREPLDPSDYKDGESPEEIYGEHPVRLYLNGGNELWTKVTGISTDIPDSYDGDGISIQAQIFNWTKTDWKFNVSDGMSHRDVLEQFINYIESTDDKDREWEYVVVDGELKIRPVQDEDPTRHTYTEGQNVIRPEVTRTLDGVINFVQVDGKEGLNVWGWAYDGDYYISRSTVSVLANGVYPDDASDKNVEVYTYIWKSTPGTNDTDEIGLRPEYVNATEVQDWERAEQIAKDTLEQGYESVVSGVAPVAGVEDVEIGDKAEIYYPSRGIPQKVEDNVYRVKKIQYKVTPRKAQTDVEWANERPTVTDVIGNAAVQEFERRGNTEGVSGTSGSAGGGGGGGFSPVVGTIKSLNDDGTATVEAEDGTTYDNVRII